LLDHHSAHLLGELEVPEEFFFQRHDFVGIVVQQNWAVQDNLPDFCVTEAPIFINLDQVLDLMSSENENLWILVKKLLNPVFA